MLRSTGGQKVILNDGTRDRVTVTPNGTVRIGGTDGQTKLDIVDSQLVAYRQLVMSNSKITGLATPTANTDATTKAYVDAINPAGRFLPLAGGTMTGQLNMGQQQIIEISVLQGWAGNNFIIKDGAGTNRIRLGQALAIELYSANGTLNLSVTNAATSFAKQIAMSSNKITGLGTPTEDFDAANKKYVDDNLPSGGPWLPLSGGTLTGFLFLHADPTSALHASTKGYVDTGLSGKSDSNHGHTEYLRTDGSNNPSGEGAFITQGAGDTRYLQLSGGVLSGFLTLHNDPVIDLHAATKGYVDNLVALVPQNFLPLAGGTMTGAIAMGTNKITGLGAPTADADAATKKYVDDNAGSGGPSLPPGGAIGTSLRKEGAGDGAADWRPNVFVGNTAPTGAIEGDFWMNESETPTTVFLRRSGGSMTGEQATGQKLVRNIIASSSAPSSPVIGDVWIDTST